MSADIHLDNINVDLDLALGGSVDLGLSNIGINVGGGIDVGLDNIKADLGLDAIRLKEIAPIRVDAAIKELPIIRTDSKIDLGLDDIRIRELPAIKFEFSMRPVRIHLPVNYSFCLELFGIRLFKFSVCGEGMAVTEDYQPSQTERCQ